LLRERVAAFVPGASRENVTVVNGGSEANHLTLWALLEPKDEIAVMVPNYMQGWGLGRHFTGGARAFSLRLRRGRWALDVDGLNLAVTRKTRVILVCNPNNPTGAVFNEEEMDAVVAAARRAGAWILADEIYRGAELEGEAITPSFFGRYDRVAVTGGLSKAFGLPGLRIGWVVGPKALIEKVWVRHDYTTLTPGMLSDRLGAAALEPNRRDAILARTRRIVRRQWPRLEEWLRQHEDVFAWAPPQAGAIALARYRLPVGSAALVERVRREQSVLLVPGDMMGAGRSLRFGFGYDIARTLAGLRRVDKTLAALAVRKPTAASAGRRRGSR
ncbi:MAG TPA: aminotransferase class I/II-fold pyridoxal phosphate-dependent enzyme, partial [Vicinamibacteria bacterium]|nr:aminotransferase class I/II-fold pyridoxal phosphate-dependent enzyme [Vicinamibacteria bacterium]